ncbi:hypothetical protein D3C84_442390 [compost metagenome]
MRYGARFHTKRMLPRDLYGIDHSDNDSLLLASSVARNGLLCKDSFPGKPLSCVRPCRWKRRQLIHLNLISRTSVSGRSMPIMVTTRVDQIRCNRRSSRMQTGGQVERNFAARTQWKTTLGGGAGAAPRSATPSPHVRSIAQHTPARTQGLPFNRQGLFADSRVEGRLKQKFG